MRTYPPKRLPPNSFRALPRKRLRGLHNTETGSLCGCRFGIFAWAPTRTLARDDRAAFEDLATPHAPRLTTVQRRCQAFPSNRAVDAQGLRAFQSNGALREPQVGIADMARYGR